jgi:hypothetical protein
MDAHLKGVGRQALQQECEIGAVPTPEPVGHAPGLQRDVSLEVQKRRQKVRSSRDRERQCFADPGSLRRPDRARPETLHGRRVQAAGGQPHSCRAVHRFDGRPHYRGRNDRGSRPTERRQRTDRWPGRFLPHDEPTAKADRLVQLRCGSRPSASGSAGPEYKPSRKQRQRKGHPQKQTARLLFANGRLIAVRLYGGTSPEALAQGLKLRN